MRSFPAVGRVMQLVQQLFRVFPRLVEQRRVLGVANAGRRAGGVHSLVLQAVSNYSGDIIYDFVLNTNIPSSFSRKRVHDK